ncbi:hypothetical protein D9M69_659890 [compost metagenome]
MPQCMDEINAQKEQGRRQQTHDQSRSEPVEAVALIECRNQCSQPERQCQQTETVMSAETQEFDRIVGKPVGSRQQRKAAGYDIDPEQIFP